LVHHYADVDRAIVFRVLKNELDEFKALVSSLVRLA